MQKNYEKLGVVGDAEFEAWWLQNAEDLFNLTGIAHPRARSAGIVRLVYSLTRSGSNPPISATLEPDQCQSNQPNSNRNQPDQTPG